MSDINMIFQNIFDATLSHMLGSYRREHSRSLEDEEDLLFIIPVEARVRFRFPADHYVSGQPLWAHGCLKFRVATRCVTGQSRSILVPSPSLLVRKTSPTNRKGVYAIVLKSSCFTCMHISSDDLH